ncbi:MAG: type II toxin-antitoxin system RelE/ParE family toxin [Bauldia sp.]
MAHSPKKNSARFYETATGRRPVRQWLLGLSRDDRRVVGTDIQKVEFGWPLGMPYCRPLSGGVWEVRSDLESGRTARVIFCIVAGEMILLHAFIKKSQKTPQAELNLALKRKRDVT